MTSLPLAQILHRDHAAETALTCRLSYDARFLRRKKLIATDGTAFVVDLAQTTSLDAGDALELEDGRLVRIEAEAEAVLIVTGPDLARLAWHIGNRHTPCQIEAGRLVIQNDPVIGHMLAHLGATSTPATEPFTPEGGAYGHGRTHAHAHGHTAHGHTQGHGVHDHAHDDHAHGHHAQDHARGHSAKDHGHAEGHSHAPGRDHAH